MGREAKILLGILGLLAGVFVGVLSMKLLVPRPPTGAGPDIHADLADAGDHDLVEPPRLAATVGADQPATDTLPPPPADEPRSRFTRPPADIDAPVAAAPLRDPFVAPAGYDAEPAAPAAVKPQAPAQPPAPVTLGQPLPSGPATPSLDGAAALATPAVAADYVARPGDSWWTLAERVYGDGRFYRALFAWNRAIDPRVSLVPGTTLELPPADRLRVVWPGLVPRD
jgi:nucleoid-associated protein YgaU